MRGDPDRRDGISPGPRLPLGPAVTYLHLVCTHGGGCPASMESRTHSTVGPAGALTAVDHANGNLPSSRGNNLVPVEETNASALAIPTEDQALRHNQQLRPLSEAFPKVAGLRGPALIIPVTTPCLTIKTRAWQQTVVAQIYLIPQLIDWIVMGHPRHRSGKRQLACLVVSPLAHRRTGNPTYRWLRGRPRHCFKTLPSLKVVTRLLTQYHELSLRKL